MGFKLPRFGGTLLGQVVMKDDDPAGLFGAKKVATAKIAPGPFNLDAEAKPRQEFAEQQRASALQRSQQAQGQQQQLIQ